MAPIRSLVRMRKLLDVYKIYYSRASSNIDFCVLEALLKKESRESFAPSPPSPRSLSLPQVRKKRGEIAQLIRKLGEEQKSNKNRSSLSYPVLDFNDPCYEDVDEDDNFEEYGGGGGGSAPVVNHSMNQRYGTRLAKKTTMTPVKVSTVATSGAEVSASEGEKRRDTTRDSISFRPLLCTPKFPE